MASPMDIAEHLGPFDEDKSYLGYESKYRMHEQVGQGAYGAVFLAEHVDTGTMVAMKKFQMTNEKEGFPLTAVREIKILRKLSYDRRSKDHIVALHDVVSTRATDYNRELGTVYMVFEFFDHDLQSLLESHHSSFSAAQIKSYVKQLLSSLFYAHANKILHRDLKAANLLVNNRGELRLADFGLSRMYYDTQPDREYTVRVITRWYRSPELLLGFRKYSRAVDMWSAGCLVAEFLTGKPLFPGKSELDQLDVIFKLCGTPTEQSWPGVTALPEWQAYKRLGRPQYPNRLRQHFRHLDPAAVELLADLLSLDPSKRISAGDALDCRWLWNDPLPLEPHEMPRFPVDREIRRRRLAKQQRVCDQQPQPAQQPQAQQPQAQAPAVHPQAHQHQHHANARRQHPRYPPAPGRAGPHHHHQQQHQQPQPQHRGYHYNQQPQHPQQHHAGGQPRGVRAGAHHGMRRDEAAPGYKRSTSPVAVVHPPKKPRRGPNYGL